MNSNKEYAQQMREGAVIVDGVVRVSTDLWEHTANIIENSVRVIRCKNCIFGKYIEDSGNYKCTSFNGRFGIVKADDFCSYGERLSDK